jgi:hypothetical protein
VSLSFTAFVAGNKITANSLTTRLDKVEDYVNQDLIIGDLQTSTEWVDESHIYKPDPYRAPSPRFEAVSGDTFFAFTKQSRSDRAVFHQEAAVDGYRPIPGLCRTFKITDPSTTLTFAAYFYASEIGTSTLVTEQRELTSVARFKLLVNGTQQVGSRRTLHATTSGSFLFGRKNLSMVGSATLGRGVHSIGVYIRPLPLPINDYRHIYIESRGILIDAHTL